MSIVRVITRFFTELRRRRVLNVGGVYIAGAWLITEIASFALEQAMAPAWAFRLLAIVFVAGFPLAMVLAWVIQIQPGGKWSIDPSSGQRRTIIFAVAMGLLVTAGLSWLILPHLDDTLDEPTYQPIPHSVAFLPLTMELATDRERAIASTLHTALGNGLDQSAELILINLGKLKDQPGNLLEFGRSVKAAALLTGKILQVAGGTRIEIGLLDVGRGEQTWSQTYEWNPTRIVDTGTAIANSVLGAMELPALSRVTFTGTDHPEAYEAFLSGRQNVASLNVVKLLKAIDDFQRAIDLDPGYVLAYVSLAETIGWYIRYTGPLGEERKMLIKRRMQALETALELDSESAAAISALGTTSPDRELAIQAFEHALELDPNHAKSYLRLGKREAQIEEAERLVRKALELDPLNADWYNDLAGILWSQERDEEAFATLRKSIELEPELVWNNYKLSVWSGYDYGRLDEAIIYARKAYSLDSRNSSIAWEVAGWYIDIGAREEALAWVKMLLELHPGDSFGWLAAGVASVVFGDEDVALERFKRALELDPGNTWALREVVRGEITHGHTDIAYERWQRVDPVMMTSENPVVEFANMDAAIFIGQFFMKIGETDRAEHLLNGCVEIMNSWEPGSGVREGWMFIVEPEIYATLALKEETLAAMRRSIIDRHYRATNIWYSLPVFDFIRDEPEFRELMEIVHNDLAEQLKRVRKMECSGELAPAPGLAQLVDCN